MLLTCGAFTTQGEFVELPELAMERLEAAWQEAVFALYLAEGKIEPEVVENMRSWQHSGFSVDQSVFLPAGGAKSRSGTNCRGHYSNKSRGMRKKAEAEQAEKAAKPSSGDDASGAAPTAVARPGPPVCRQAGADQAGVRD